MRWHEGQRICRDEFRMSCKQCDKLRSVAKHPKGSAGAAIPYKINQLLYCCCCTGLAHLLCLIGMRSIALPCSMGFAEVSNSIAGICPKAYKEAGQEVSAMRNEWLLLWEAEGG